MLGDWRILTGLFEGENIDVETGWRFSLFLGLVSHRLREVFKAVRRLLPKASLFLAGLFVIEERGVESALTMGAGGAGESLLDDSSGLGLGVDESLELESKYSFRLLSKLGEGVIPRLEL